MSALVTTARGGPSGPNGAEVGDGELVRRVRRGDEVAFEQLYERYQRRITVYIFGMLHDHGRAEDLVQDVFVSALRRIRATDRPIAFKPWIYEIAKNACIDQFRRARRTEEVSYDAGEGIGAGHYGRLVSSRATPESELESKQSLADLRGAFGGLSETHHEILVMRELEGLSYREIGERLGMSRSSVESTLFRARRRLTEEYEELASGARCRRIQAIITGAAAAAPGARDQRRLARHVSHCQPCRRQARLAGLDVPSVAGRPVRQRIAALLPLPLFLKRRWSPSGADVAPVDAGPLPSLAGWSAQLGAMDPGWLKAAATAATVAIAGAAAGVPAPPPSRSGPAGAFARLLPLLERPGAGRGLPAGSGPRVAAAFRAGAGSRAARRVAVAPAAPGAAARGPQEAPATAASSAPRAPAVRDAAARVTAPARSLAGAVSSLASPGSGTAGGGGTAGGVPPPAGTTPPPDDGAPSAAPVDASGPDPVGLAQEGRQKAQDALDDALAGG